MATPLETMQARLRMATSAAETGATLLVDVDHGSAATGCFPGGILRLRLRGVGDGATFVAGRLFDEIDGTEFCVLAAVIEGRRAADELICVFSIPEELRLGRARMILEIARTKDVPMLAEVPLTITVASTSS